VRHGVVVVAVLLTAVLAATAGSAQGARDLQAGIFDDAQLVFGSAKTTVAEYEQLHVHVVRLTLHWGGFNGVANAKPRHPQSPADPAYDWSIYDHLIRRIAKAKMQVVLSIYGTPKWANNGRTPNVAPVDPRSLRNFALAAARRYSGNFRSQGSKLPAVREWIAWNEPNNPVFLKPQFRRTNGHWFVASANAYAKICNAIYRGVHSTRYRGEKVACGVTAPRGNNQPTSSRPSVSPLAFLTAAKHDGLVTFDAWAHNPYYANPSEGPAAKDGRHGSVELGNIGKLISLVTDLYGKKPIWITEYGYETKPPDEFFGVPWNTQATYLTRAFEIARRNPRIDMMLWFLLRDDANKNGWQSGLITVDGEKKPSYAAFAHMAAGL
jgi:hypothetical protein